MRKLIVVMAVFCGGAAMADSTPDLEAPDPCAQQREMAERAKGKEFAASYATSLAECEATATQRKRLGVIRADRKQMTIVLGAVSCAIQFQKTSALEEIAKEKKYAKVGGVLNKAKMYELQQKIRKADETMAMFKAKAKAKPYAGIVPAACKSADVQKTLTCHDSPQSDECGQREADYNVFVADFVDGE